MQASDRCIIDTLIGPFILPGTLTGALYCDFLTNDLNVLLEEVPFNLINLMWFMHDRAPPHFALAARAILHQRFPNKWIGHQGPKQWPARSSFDIYLCGHLKAIVYSTPIHNMEILRQRIEQGCQQIWQMPGIWERARQSMMQQSESCIIAHGSHFAHLL